MSTEFSASQLIDQLTSIFQKQKHFLTSDHNFEDMSEWERLNEAWDVYSTKLEEKLTHSALQHDERDKMRQLIESHKDLYSFAEAEHIQIRSDLTKVNHSRKVRTQYEGYSSSGSVFYDERK